MSLKPDQPEFDGVRRSRWPGVLAVGLLGLGLLGLGVVLSRPPPVAVVPDELRFERGEADRRARPLLIISAPAPQAPVGGDAPSAPPPPQGVIAVGGQRLNGGEVFVDGTSVGFAPRQLEVSVGLHPVEVRLPSGERVGPRVMSVGRQHTALAPLRRSED